MSSSTIWEACEVLEWEETVSACCAERVLRLRESSVGRKRVRKIPTARTEPWLKIFWKTDF